MVYNIGSRDGHEVIQMYIQDKSAKGIARPEKMLKGFEKVGLAPGESKNIQFTITEEDLKFYDINMNFLAEDGDFKLWVSNHSSDESNEISFQLKH